MEKTERIKKAYAVFIDYATAMDFFVNNPDAVTAEEKYILGVEKDGKIYKITPSLFCTLLESIPEEFVTERKL